jgi:hypothetical protein
MGINGVGQVNVNNIQDTVEKNVVNKNTAKAVDTSIGNSADYKLATLASSSAGIRESLNEKLPQTDLVAQSNSSGISRTMKSKLDAAGLTKNQRADAEQLLRRFTNTTSYQEMENSARRFVDNYFTGTIISSVKNPKNRVLANTVEGVAGGKIRLSVSNDPPTVRPNGSSTVTYGTAYSDGIRMNMHPTGGIPSRGSFSQYKFNEILAHEVNHYINDKRVPNPANNNADRFWNEYRAFVVGRVGAGENPNNFNKRVILDNLIGANSSYPELRQLYLSDSRLRAVIDKALSGNPNDRFSVNDMRNALVNDGGYSSLYITQASNTDNNLNGL